MEPSDSINKGKMPEESSQHCESVHPPKKPESKKPPKRKRRLTSPVWQFFDIIEPKEGEDPSIEKCRCKKCGMEYLTDSKYGTRNFKRHLLACAKKTTTHIGQLILSQQDKVLGTRSSKFNPERFRELLVHALIKHDLPLSFVEYEGVREIFTYLCSEAQAISRKTARTDILKLHHKELQRLRLTMRELPGRVCLTSDLWTSIATDGYLSLTAHFVDKNWVLHKRILNFSYMSPPHTGIALTGKVYDLLSNWRIENNLFSITLDNASANDVFVGMLKNHLNLKKALLGEGSFFHIRCCAHILNLVVHDGLKEIDVVVDKVRECVKYMKGSQARKQKFLECVAQHSLDSKKGLRQDVPTRWNSTFLMLECAIYFRHAFVQLQLSDPNFKHCPSQEEWNKVEKICEFLKVFYKATCVFSGSNYPTSNLYFPKVVAIQLLLNKEAKSDDAFMKRMATQMLGKFEKYWSEHCVILAIGVILDPRYKFQFVEYSYKKLYGDESSEVSTHCMQIREKLFSLFNEYNAKSSPKVLASRNVGEGDASQECNDSDFIEDFDTFESVTFVSSAQKSQLELYLDEPRVDRKQNLDILAYWRAYYYRYPELASMARDVLSIPISTVASESAFSIGGRILDKYRSALRPPIVEALICSRDWLFGGREIDEVSLDDIVEDVINFKINIDEHESVESSSTIVDLES